MNGDTFGWDGAIFVYPDSNNLKVVVPFPVQAKETLCSDGIQLRDEGEVPVVEDGKVLDEDVPDDGRFPYQQDGSVEAEEPHEGFPLVVPVEAFHQLGDALAGQHHVTKVAHEGEGLHAEDAPLHPEVEIPSHVHVQQQVDGQRGEDEVRDHGICREEPHPAADITSLTRNRSK